MQPVRDPEPARERVPASYSPTPARTRPFLRARPDRDPGPGSAPVSIVHDVQTSQVPPYSSRPAPANTQTPTPSPIQKPRPQITAPLPERFKFVGRGVGRERTFFEVIELLTLTQREGDFPRGITDRMRKYYRQTYPEYFSASKRSAGKR